MSTEEQKLYYFEELCMKLYTSPSYDEKNEAQKSLMEMCGSTSFIPTCQYIIKDIFNFRMILNKSQNQFALTLASNALTQLITENWTSFQSAQKQDIRKYIIDYLASYTASLAAHVRSSLIKLYCRIIKLGWLSDSESRVAISEIEKFLNGDVNHNIIGLELYTELVSEINNNNVNKSESRKIAYYFRELHLKDIFEKTIQTLQTIERNEIEITDDHKRILLVSKALNLVIQCLSFDFIGTNPDETGMETNAVYAPISWRTIIQEQSTMNIFVDLYDHYDPPITCEILECLVYFVSIRRTLFADADNRSSFLSGIMKMICSIIMSEKGLNDENTYHMLCRLLGRLKSNYQLSDLVSLPDYYQWIRLVAEFTIKSLQQGESCDNGIQYLLMLWNRLIAAVPVLKSNSEEIPETYLDQYIPKIVVAYIESRLSSVTSVDNQGSSNDLLGNLELVAAEMKQIPSIFRYKYRETANNIISEFNPLSLQYDEVLRQLAAVNTQENIYKLKIIEGKLAWLVNMIANILTSQSYVEMQLSMGQEDIDADLSKKVFDLLEKLDYQLDISHGNTRADYRLELSLLAFIQRFRQAYIIDQYSYGLLSVPKKDIYERMGHGDSPKYWYDNPSIIKESIITFMDFTVVCLIDKVLLTLEPVKDIINNHVSQSFVFLNYPANFKYRTLYYTTLTKLVFTDKNPQSLDIFLKPIVETLTNLSNVPDLNNNSQLKNIMIGVLLDLRGIIASTSTSAQYVPLFELIIPFFPLFQRIASLNITNLELLSPLLKFLSEFCNNKQNRITFKSCSANGIILFKNASVVITNFGTNLLSFKYSEDPTDQAIYLKGIKMYLNVLNNALSGDYTNFGVFALYNDNCFENTIKTAFQLIFSVPFNVILEYPKTAYNTIYFYELLMHNHLNTFLYLDGQMFGNILDQIQSAIKSSNFNISSAAYISLTHFVTYYYNNINKTNQEMIFFRQLLPCDSNVWATLLYTLLLLLLLDRDLKGQWQISRAMLPIILINKNALQMCIVQIQSTQNPENQIKLEGAFGRLVDKLEPKLDGSTIEKFTQRATQFRNEVRQYLEIGNIMSLLL